jgi:hypothetical protein
MPLAEWWLDAIDWARSLGTGYWLGSAIVIAVWAGPGLARWWPNRAEQRVDREYSDSAKRRWPGSQPDPWIKRLRDGARKRKRR